MEYTEQQRADMRRWVDIWKETGPILERIKAEELAAMSEEEGVRAFNSLDCNLDLIWRSPERTNAEGMIEQQRLFMKAHRHAPGLPGSR